MNISRLEAIRSIPADDLPDFAEAIADATHYLANAINYIPEAIEANSAELWQALELLNSYALIAERKKSEKPDFSGIENAIAAELKAPSIHDLKDGTLLLHRKSKKLYRFMGFEKSWILVTEIESGESFKFLGYSLIDYALIAEQEKSKKPDFSGIENAIASKSKSPDIDPTDTEQLATESV